MPKQSRSKRKKPEEKATWNPITGRWECNGMDCSKEFGPDPRQVHLMHSHWNAVHRVVHRVVSFDCAYCERSFGLGTTRRRHVKLLHTVPPPSVSNMEQCPWCLYAWLHVSEHSKFCPMPNGRDGEPRAGWEWNDDLGRCVRIEREADSWDDPAESRRSESPEQDEENVDRSSLPAPTQPQTEQQGDVSHWPQLRYLSPTFDSPRPLHRHLAQSASSQPFHHFETSELADEHFDTSRLEPHSTHRFKQFETAPTFNLQNHSTNTPYAFRSEYRPHQAFQIPPFPQYSNEYIDPLPPAYPLPDQRRGHDFPSDIRLPNNPDFYTEPYLLNHALPPSAIQSLPSHPHAPDAPYYQTSDLAYSPQFPAPPPHDSHDPPFFPTPRRPLRAQECQDLSQNGSSLINPRLTGTHSNEADSSHHFQPRHSLGKARIPLTHRQAVRYCDLGI